MRAEIARSFEDLGHGRTYSLDEVRANLWNLTRTHIALLSETVQGQLRGIKIISQLTTFQNRQGANTVKNILYGLERLEVFPKRFDADEE